MLKRKHHYVPVFHLSGFTEDGTNESTLWVLDLKTSRQWNTYPRNIAYEKDFYKVDLPETDPDAVENIFAYLETNVTPIIRRICETREMPSGEDFNWLMNYIALLEVRTPTRRDSFSSFMEDVAKFILKTIFDSEENFKAVRNRMSKEGYEVPDNVTYEELRDFVKGERYAIKFDNNTHVRDMLVAMDVVLQTLGQRNWTIVHSPKALGDFVCSDHPVSLHWVDNSVDRGIFSSPGHGLPGTEVTVPLSSRLLLLGRYECDMPSTIKLDDQLTLAKLNSYSCMNCKRFIYSRNKDFIWYTRDGKIGTVDDLKRFINRGM